MRATSSKPQTRYTSPTETFLPLKLAPCGQLHQRPYAERFKSINQVQLNFQWWDPNEMNACSCPCSDSCIIPETCGYGNDHHLPFNHQARSPPQGYACHVVVLARIKRVSRGVA
jgi:hypothetical protein